MNLDDTQRKQVSQWIAEGLKLSEIQSRLASELGVRLTYMDVRLLVDDLKLTPKDVEPAKSIPSVLAGPGAPPTAGTRAPAARPGTEASKPASPGGVSPGISLAVDQITRPGALVSGKVTFSDGNKADWYFDQTGQLGLFPQSSGYRPPASDLQQFQAALQTELSKLGF